MTLLSFDVIPKSLLGVDIGTSAVRVVEISSWGERKTLRNYAELLVPSLYDKPFRTFEKNALLLSSQDIARALRAVLQEANIQQKKAVFSISDFSSFFTTLELPSSMKKSELADAVRFEARRHVPLALSEVTLDWQLLEDPGKDRKQPFRVLLVAVPNEFLHQYQEIARLAGLELVVLEAEVFGCIRSYVTEDQPTTVLLDIGAQTTTVSVVQRGMLQNSHSMDIGGMHFTERISKALSVDYKTADEEKRAQGIHLMAGEVEILLPLMDMIVSEAEKAADDFAQRGTAQVEKIVLSGGMARLPGLQEYFQKSMRKKTEIIDPFRSLLYPPILESTLKERGPSFAVAVGMALRGTE